MGANGNGLRVLVIAGSLGNGGAEKQLLYLLRTFQNMGVQSQVISMTKGEFHERSLQQLGVQPISLAELRPPARLAQVIRTAREFHPHIIQAAHFFTTFYAGLAGRLTRTVSIGAIRGDVYHDLAGVGKQSKLLLRLTTALLANSYNARENALHLGVSPRRIYVLPNVIDLEAFDRRFAASPETLLRSDRLRVTIVARLIPVKRLERFLQAVSVARQSIPELEGVIVGGGPEEDRLKSIATSLGLMPDRLEGAIRFLGEQAQIPQILAQSSIFALTSEREGFPNVLLEAMAASLPVITTPAGEAPRLVQDGINGYLVPFDDPQVMADRIIELARSRARRIALGRAGRRLVEDQYNYAGLGKNILQIYAQVAELESTKTVQLRDILSQEKQKPGIPLQDPYASPLKMNK